MATKNIYDTIGMWVLPISICSSPNMAKHHNQDKHGKDTTYETKQS